MAISPGWITTKPLCGVNDPLGREDTANKYLRGSYRKYRVGHKADASHKSGIYDIDFACMGTGSYSGTGAGQKIYLANSNLLIQTIKIVGDTAEWPVISQVELADNFQEDYDSGLAGFFDLAAYDGNLYVGAQTLTPSARILKYDGSSWSTAYDPPGEESVRSLAAYDGNLYAGTHPGGKIYEYNGSSWSEAYDSTESQIRGLGTYNNVLYAGSYSNGKIFEYNGSSWSEAYDSAGAWVYDLLEFDGDLYIGTSNDGQLLLYNGSSWSTAYDFPTGDEAVLALGIYNNVLYAGVDEKIYRRTGEGTWELAYTTSEAAIYRLAEFNGKLFAATASNGKIFAYDGSTWSEVADLSASAWGLCEYNGALYAAAGSKIYIRALQSKELNTQLKQTNRVIDIDTPGEFILGTDDSVNKLNETYHYWVSGIIVN